MNIEIIEDPIRFHLHGVAERSDVIAVNLDRQRHDRFPPNPDAGAVSRPGRSPPFI